MKELQAVSWIIFFNTVIKEIFNLYMPKSSFVSDYGFLYILLLLQLLYMGVTGIYLLWKTYQEDQIIPFPITEDCITNFEVAIIMPTSMTHFYSYLSRLRDCNEALIMFGLHADIRLYMRMVDQQDFYTEDEIRQ